MDSKIRIYEKTIYILSSGIVLIMSVQHIRSSEVKKLSQKLSNLKLEYNDFDSEHSILSDAYSELVSQLEDSPSIYDKYIINEFDYRVRSYIPTLSNDLVSYTFYDDYIKIDLLNNNEVYSSCYYNNDGSYYIVCSCRNESYRSDDRLYTVTYNFSSDGVLTNYIIYDGFFEIQSTYANDDTNNYKFIKKINR